MEIFKKIFKTDLFKNEKIFFEKYIQISFLLNALVISLSIIYELGVVYSFYGQIVGIFFILTFFYNLGLVFLNDKYMNRTVKSERKLHLLTYGYIIFAIITTTTLISLGLGDIKRQIFNPFYYILFCFAIVISYLDYKNLKTSEGKISKEYVQIGKKERIIILILKKILIILSLLTFFFAGLFAFNILSGGAPLVLFLYLINIYLPVFFPMLILLVPIITLLLYKVIPRKWKKVGKSLTIIGFFLTITLSLPFIAAPVSIIDSNNQFANIFGRNWNKFDSGVEEEFSDIHHVIIQSWFGEPELDPDSWKLDSSNVYKETDDYKLKFDVYYPGKIAAQFIGKKSTIIFIHGGGWTRGGRWHGAPYLKYFAAQGYVCFSIDYRLLEQRNSPDKSFVGDYNIENMMRDIANFTQYLAANENEDGVHGADLDNVFLMGQSAGAHLAAVTGFGYNDDEWGLHEKLKIKGIVLFYPPNSARRFFYEDYSIYYENGFTKYKTPDEDPDFYDLYTPSKLVDDDDPPCLIFQGSSDTYVPYINSEEIKKACDNENVDCILVTNFFVGHAHDISVLFKTMSIYYIERFFYLIKED
jgi:acetyl esterase/lipase